MHDLAQTREYRVDVDAARQPYRERRMVGGTARLQTLEEPRALLRERQRNARRTRHGHEWQYGGSPGLALHAIDLLRQRRDGRRVEQHAQRQLHVEQSTHAGDHLRREERMPADLEEIVIDADSLAPQHVGPDAREHLVQSGPRLDSPAARGYIRKSSPWRVVAVRRRQRRADQRSVVL